MLIRALAVLGVGSSVLRAEMGSWLVPPRNGKVDAPQDRRHGSGGGYDA